MKNTRKILITALSLVMTVVLFALMPISVYAEDATMTQSGVLVSTADITIDPSENPIAEGKAPDVSEKIELPVHTMAVMANGASFSSFELQLRLPAFVTVTEVRVGEVLASSENQVFTPYVDEENGQVNVAYSNPNSFANVALFYIDFTVNDYTEQYGNIEQVKCSFVSEDAKSVSSSCSFGTIRIEQEKMGMKGDVNGDSKVTLADLLVIQRSLVNKNFPLDQTQMTAADIDNNGNVDMIDCQYIQNYLVGKIDSLENIGGYVPPLQTYSITVNAFDTNGNRLYGGVFMAVPGEEYNSFLNQVRAAVSARYSIEAYDGLRSDMYGELDPNTGSDGLRVKGDDTVTMIFKLAGGETVKDVQYTYSTTYDSEDGSVTLLTYTFYRDNTVLGVMERIVDGKTDERVEETLKWKQIGEYIDVYMQDGTAKRMFVVSADGMLSEYNGEQPEQPEQPDYPTDDYLQQVSYNFAVGVVVGSDPSVLVEKFCKQTITMIFSQSGEYVVQITPDMIDYQTVNFNEVGEYEVTISYSVNGRKGEIYTDVYVIEDKSDVEVLGVYGFQDESGEIGINMFTVYADGTLMIDDYCVTPYETLKQGVVAFSFDGGDLVIALDDVSKTASFYQPSESLIGKYVYGIADTFSMTFEIYGEYTGAGYYVAVYRVDAGEYKVALTTRAYLDLEGRELRHAGMPCDMTFDENGTLVENHDEQLRVEAPTCDQCGWEIYECSKCHREISRNQIPALGHSFGEDGSCVNCGCFQGDSSNIEQERMMALEQMQREWINLQTQYGDISPYSEQYNKYFNEIKSATELYIIEEYMNYFWNLVQEIHNKFGSQVVCPNNWYLEKEIPGNVNQGESIDDYIKNYILTNRLVVHMSDGQILYIPIDSNMISGYSADFSALGEVVIYINCAQADFAIDHNVHVVVNPDFSKLELLGTYTFNDTAGTGWSTISLYTGGVLQAGNQSFSYSMINDDLIEIMHGAPILIALNNEAKSASFYTPVEPLIGTYTLAMGDNTLVFNVYGKYEGCGQYVTVLKMLLGDGAGGIKQEMTVTSKVELDMECCTLYHSQYGTMTFDENGNLSHGDVVEPDQPVEPEYPGEDLENYRDQVKDQLKEMWSEIDQGEYEVSEEHRAHFNDIMNRVYEVQEYWELDELLREARQICNQIKGIRELEWTNNSGIPHRVIAGITMEEFVEMLNRAKLILHYSDGSEEEVLFTAEMFNLSRLDLNNEGEYTISWSYQHEGLEESINGMTHIEVIENKAAGANMVGEYTYLPRIEGAENVMEWTSIKLYDNGYALLCDDYGMRFVEYEVQGNLVIYNYYDVICVLEIQMDDSGKPMGIAYYRPETNEVYIYDDKEDMYFRVEVFVIGERSFAFFDVREYNNDGSQDVYELSAEIFFNQDKTKVFSMVLEAWFEITEGNVLVPCECEHRFDESGYCQYCGENANGDQGQPDVGVEDEVISGGSTAVEDTVVEDKVVVENEQ